MARRWIVPRFAAGPLSLVSARHPLLADAVPNSIAVVARHGALITGSNMSGKSTLLRTIGVNVVLAQSIFTVLADDYTAPVLRLRSCIGRHDDLLSGRSYYLAEAESVLSIVNASASPEPHLFIFDELFRGTNAVERIAAAEAVLRELTEPADRGPHVVVVATHDAELVDLLQDRYEAFHFTDDLDADGLVFHYRLESGPATTRNAIALLKLYGAPPRLVERALNRAAALDRLRRV